MLNFGGDDNLCKNVLLSSGESEERRLKLRLCLRLPSGVDISLSTLQALEPTCQSSTRCREILAKGLQIRCTTSKTVQSKMNITLCRITRARSFSLRAEQSWPFRSFFKRVRGKKNEFDNFDNYAYKYIETLPTRFCHFGQDDYYVYISWV